MIPDKKNNEQESEPAAGKINLNDYAGDAEDNAAAKRQSNNYREDAQNLDRNLDEQIGGSESNSVSDEG